MSPETGGLFIVERRLPPPNVFGEPYPQPQRQQIPLLGVRVDVTLQGPSTEVRVAQRYRNDEEKTIEAVYVFPLEEGAAICGFAARLGDRVVRGQVQERDEAFETYDDAMADGHGAFLLDQERPNIFTASVGNLRPGEEVEIEITYVALARDEGDAVRLTIPTTISPRYVPADGRVAEVGEPDGDRVNPEHLSSVPYGLQLRVEVDGTVRSVDSPSHPIRLQLKEGGATVELAREEAALDRDFVLLVEPMEPRQPLVRIAREVDGTAAAMLSFLPDAGDREIPCEVVFVLDCSGSMLGDSIAQAKRALLLSIRALNEGDTFNVIRFGSRMDKMWNKPRVFSQENLDEANRYVERISADLGGTEILNPLRQALTLRPDAERQRRILLLTDGQVSNEAAIIAEAESHKDKGRIFTFGIGAGASEFLVRELARVTGGAAEMIFPGERIEPKVLRAFGRVHQPVEEVEIEWQGLDVVQAPATTPAAFGGDRLTVFGRIRKGKEGAAVLRVGEREWSLPVVIDDTASEAPLVPILWARQRIRDLETGAGGRRGSAQKRDSKERRQRQEIVDLGYRYGLMSSATSYVAVEERPEGERTGDAELRKIPVALTTGWGGSRGFPQGLARRKLRTGGRARGTSVTTRSMIASAVPRAELSDAPAFAAPPSPAAPPMDAMLAFDALSLEDVSFGGAPPRKESTDRLYDLLLTQQINGSFLLSSVLENWLGDHADAVRSAAKKHDEALVVTAVVVLLLERDEANRADEWRAAIRKAKRYVEKNGGFDASGLLA